MSVRLTVRLSIVRNFFLLAGFIGLISSGPAKAEEEMETRFYPVPPSFFRSGGGGGAGLVDPFAVPAEEEKNTLTKLRTPKEILERAGVTFGVGAYAWAFHGEGRGSILVVRNTPDQHELVEAYGCYPGPGVPLQMTVIVEHIEVDAAWLSRWILDHRLDRDGTPLREDVQQLVRAKKAKVADTSIVTMRSGQRARSESVWKIRYPGSGDPPEIPNSVKLETKTEAPVTSIGPTSFPGRDIGIFLEADAVIGANNTTIDLNLAPERILRDGETLWPLDDSDARFRHEKPTFFTGRVTTQVTLTDRHYVILGTVDPLESGLQGAKESKVLVFVRADIGRPTEGGPE